MAEAGTANGQNQAVPGRNITYYYGTGGEAVDRLSPMYSAPPPHHGPARRGDLPRRVSAVVVLLSVQVSRRTIAHADFQGKRVRNGHDAAYPKRGGAVSGHCGRKQWHEGDKGPRYASPNGYHIWYTKEWLDDWKESIWYHSA